MIYNAHNDLSYRSGADPAVVEFQDEYYMFVTRSMGYGHSKDLNNWEFIEPQKWYFEGSNAPAAFNYKDSLLYVMGNPSGSMSPIYSNSPKKGDWKAVPGILNNLQDPALSLMTMTRLISIGVLQTGIQINYTTPGGYIGKTNWN